MPAIVRHPIERHCKRNSLAGIGQRWREVERAMGIEPTRDDVAGLNNKRFGENADAKCD